MKLFKLVMVVAVASILWAGCAGNRLVPKSKISLTDASGKKVNVELPKDMEAGDINFARATDGGISLAIHNIKVRTNPDVINAAGAAQAEAISKLTELCTKLLEAAEKGAVKSVVPVP